MRQFSLVIPSIPIVLGLGIVEFEVNGLFLSQPSFCLLNSSSFFFFLYKNRHKASCLSELVLHIVFDFKWWSFYFKWCYLIVSRISSCDYMHNKERKNSTSLLFIYYL